MTRRFPVHVSQTCSFQAGLWDHWTLEIRWPGRGLSLLHPMTSVPPGPSQYLFAWNRNSAQVLPLHAWLGRVEKRLFTTNKEDQEDTDRGRTDEVGTPRSAAFPDLASNVRWEGWFKELAAQELPWKSYLTALFFLGLISLALRLEQAKIIPRSPGFWACTITYSLCHLGQVTQPVSARHSCLEK